MRSLSRRRAAGGLIRPRTIAGQLGRILAVSLVLVLVLLGLTMATQVSAYRRSGETVDAVALALLAQDLVHQVQRERGLSNGLLGGDERLGPPVLDQRADTDTALRILAEAVAAGPPGATALGAALNQLAGVPGLRARIDTRAITRQAAFQFYSDSIDAVNRAALGLDQARDPAIRHGLQALYALGDAKEFTARERGFLNGVFAAGAFAEGEYLQFLDIRAARAAAFTQFERDATAAQRDRIDAVRTGASAALAARAENIAIASMAGPLTHPVDPATWWAQMTDVIDAQRTVQQAIGADIRARADELRRTALLTLAAYALAALLAVAAEVVLVIASVRAIVRPLSGLAGEADDVASRRLPTAIAAWRDADTAPPAPAPVRTPPGAGVEIDAVARALDRVQTTAFDLASEQALVRRNTTESLANLARRNQNLVRRQLGLISEFEREEMDPKALSNLFDLDHLATRMRRNAESLLVLVGEASPRRWAEPIALTDVIRAGLSEVDDYRRVALRRVDEIAVAGAVVSELAHALAELIENGLAFSPPDLEVEIYGRKVAGGYLLAVVDHGVGMGAEQLAEANARLRGEQDFIVASTRYLGHYVVGRLAGRLGIDVELTTSPVSGIVARMLLPPSLLADENATRPARSGDDPGALEAGSTPPAGVSESIERPAQAAAARDDLPGASADDRYAPAIAASVVTGDASAERGGAAGSAGTAGATAVTGLSLDITGGGAQAAAVRRVPGDLGAAPSGRSGVDQRSRAQVHPPSARTSDGGTEAGTSRMPGVGAPGTVASRRADSAPPSRTNGAATPSDANGLAGPGPTATGARTLRSGPTSAAAQGDSPYAQFVNGAAHSRREPTVRESVDPGDGIVRHVGPQAAPTVERTRNGLVKRGKRAKAPEAPPRGAVSEPHRPPAVERTPEQTRGLLTAFRTGHDRAGEARGEHRPRTEELR
ncbi:sensor histidine kinase [Nocardia neocaledoniensis]|uniref:sensor histidine kinase n=1 Tax=Nocardia neocaledoniensis TaxID=236511 RepID=UPI0024562875|nr:nitrate- and nitrite sensing domain-containing protein [Nocardia neocaledoniensis]